MFLSSDVGERRAVWYLSTIFEEEYVAYIFRVRVKFSLQ